MKTYWIIGIIEAVIGALGAAAYFLADDKMLAGACAVVMAVLGVYVGISRARKQAKVAAYTNQQYDKADKQMRDQLEQSEKQICPLPLPVRAVVARVASQTMGGGAEPFLAEFDRTVSALAGSAKAALSAAADFESRHPGCYSAYTVGYAAMAVGDAKKAEAAFRRAIEVAPTWADPWYGVMLSLHRQGRTTEATDHYAPMKQIQQMPHSPADDMVYVGLPDADRDQMTHQFQEVMQAQAAIYQIAHIANAIQQMNETRAALE